jgi:hypothetical protein
MKLSSILSAGVVVAGLIGSSAFARGVVVDKAISEADVISAESNWCKGLVSISETYAKDGLPAAKALAENIIDSAYGYQMGAVLFKPTLTVNPQTFRTTRAGALAYFVGGDANFPNDSGFALKGWKTCEMDNAGVFITGDSAASMGKINLTDKNGKGTTVDKTWMFVKDDKGAMRIVLHHSSLEFQN